MDQGGERIEPRNQPGHSLLALGAFFGLKHAHPVAVAEIPAGQGAAGAAEADRDAAFRVLKGAHAEHQRDAPFIQHFPRFSQDVRHGVRALGVVDQIDPFLFPTGEGSGFKPFGEASQD